MDTELKQIHLALITALEDSGVVITSDIDSVIMKALIRAKSSENINTFIHEAILF